MNRNFAKKRNRQHRDKTQHIILHVSYKIVCPYCMQEISDPNNLCNDHIMPRSRFKNTKIVVCCKKCNHEKGALTPQEYDMWKLLREKYDELTAQELALWQQLDAIRNGRVK